MVGIETLNQSLLILTDRMPCRRITVDNEAYLERYYVSTDAEGVQTWLHRFIQPDGWDRPMHSHPWFADSTIILGGYTEESAKIGSPERSTVHSYRAGDSNTINPDTLHKIVQLHGATWTVMKVKPKWGTWSFINSDGLIINMGKSHGEDWHKGYDCREYNEAS